MEALLSTESTVSNMCFEDNNYTQELNVQMDN